MSSHNHLHILGAALVASMLLCACGGGESGGPAADYSPGSPGAPVAAPAPRVVEIDLYGDSTMKAQGSANPPSEVVSRELTKRCGFTVIANNHGANGAQSAHALYGGNDLYAMTFDQAMSITKASIVVIQYGLNDTNALQTGDMWEFILSTMTAQARARGKTVVMETMNPETGWQVAYQPAMVLRQRDTAAKLNVPLVDQYGWMSQEPDVDGLLADHIHPTDATYLRKGLYLANALQPIVCPNSN